MINQDLLTYIEKEISRGTPKDIIQSNLLSNGWNEKDIIEGFSTIVVKTINPSEPTSPTNINVNQQNVTQPVSSPLIKINLPNTSEPVISQPTISNPAVSPSVMAQQNFQRMSASQIEPKKSHLTAIITVLVILLALAGGGFAYYKYLGVNISSNQNVVMQNVTTTDNINTSSVEVSSTSANVVSGGVIDCGTAEYNKIDCFINASRDCSPAKILVITEMNLFGLNVRGTTFGEIRGIQDNQCVYYTKSINSEVSIDSTTTKEALANGATTEQIKQMEQQAFDSVRPTIGRDMVCRYKNISDLTNLLISNNKGIFSTDDSKGCVGELANQPGQSANISKKITSDDCTVQKGNQQGITETGNACFKNQIDLGTVVGNMKIDGHYPQCCVQQ